MPTSVIMSFEAVFIVKSSVMPAHMLQIVALIDGILDHRDSCAFDRGPAAIVLRVDITDREWSPDGNSDQIPWQ